MQVKETLSEKLKRSYDVTVPLSTINEKTNAKLASLTKTAKVKGFRQGKVPLEVVKKQYGNAIKGEVLEQVVNETSVQALKQKNVTPAVPPKIEITEFKDDGDLKYRMEFEVLPEVPKIDFSSITLEKLEIEQSDSDVEDALKRLTSQSKQLAPSAAGTKAENGSTVKIDFEGFLGDKAFPGGKGEGFNLTLGSGQFIPGFEDQLIGAKAGDSVTVNVTFPEQYQSKDLAGKEARFEVKVHEVLESVAAELNDAFAKEFGLENLAEMRKKMREQLEADQKVFVRHKMKEQLFDKLFADYKFDVPQSMADIEFNAIWQQLMADKARGAHTELDHKSEDEVKKEYKDLATRRVSLGILLSHISKSEKVVVSQQDIVDEINRRAKQYPGQEDKVVEFYQKNLKAIQELSGPMLEEKVVDFILGKVKLDIKKTSMKQLIEEETKKAGLHKHDHDHDHENCDNPDHDHGKDAKQPKKKSKKS